jgi:hypothetical protein
MSKIYKYKSYEEYVKIQTHVNKEKIKKVYVRKTVIESIVNYINSKHSDLNIEKYNVLCHGTRNGAEQKYFKEYWPNANVLGTEISDTATNFEMTIEWDMQKQKDEWINQWDVIYLNSFDHCIYPEEALQTWKNQLSPNGFLFIEYSEKLSVGNYGDPLDATLDEVKQMMIDAGLNIEEFVDADCNHDGVMIKANK